MFISSTQLTNDQLEKKEQEFLSSTKHFDDRMVIFKELEKFFENKNAEEKFQNYLGYWRWYVDLTWRLSDRLTDKQFFLAIKEMIPMGLLLNYDIWEKTLHYLNEHAFEQATMAILYSDMQEAFVESEMIVGTWQGKKVVQKEIIDELKTLDRAETSTMQIAEFFAKVKNTIFPKNNQFFEQFLPVDPDAVVNNFITLTKNFLTINVSEIFSFVSASLTPQISVPVVGGLKGTPPHSAIRDVIEEEYEKDADGNFKEPEKILEGLELLATKYNDDKIRELFIFNEQTGSFEWNNQLLAQ